MRVIQRALTFDDVLLLPAHSRVLPREVSLKTRLTRTLELNIPLVSAATDTGTEGRRGGQGEALRVGRAARPHDGPSRDDGARGDGAAARPQDLRLPGGEER